MISNPELLPWAWPLRLPRIRACNRCWLTKMALVASTDDAIATYTEFWMKAMLPEPVLAAAKISEPLPVTHPRQAQHHAMTDNQPITISKKTDLETISFSELPGNHRLSR